MSPSVHKIASIFIVCVLFSSHVYAQSPATNEDSAARAGQTPSVGKRTPWTASRVKGTPEPPLPYTIEVAFPKLNFHQPVTITNAPFTSRLFVGELQGKIYSFPNRSDVESADLMFDIKKHVPEMANAYGFTFHPRFEENRYVYLAFVRGNRVSDGSTIARYTLKNTEPPEVDPSTQKIIYTWRGGGHNGCSIKFGPDGYLYCSTGDGTGPNPPDPDAVGQDLSNVFSSILRFDVDNPEPGKNYGIPRDNPFVDLEGARPEIWAYGFRNPWKISFDRATGDLWVGDVGWEAWEMIYQVKRGGNYGWSIMEGRQPVHPNGKRGPSPILPPVKDHDHYEARSITGGFVYRGKQLPELFGAYIYGDYSTGRMWGIRYDGERLTSSQELVNTPLAIVAFGEDNAGEVYFLDYRENTGQIYRLRRNPAEDRSRDFPRTLSATGLFSSTERHTPAPGVIPYSINSELWADHAYAERFLALPQDRQVDGWTFPDGTVIARTVYLDLERGNSESRRRVETQILHLDGLDWRPYTYVWNNAQTDATLAEAVGFNQPIAVCDSTALNGAVEQSWRVASRAECSVCHTDKLGTLLGMDFMQLDRDHDYGSGPVSQLLAWKAMGIFSKPPEPPENSRPLVDPHDSSAALADRARSYLHVNCRHCHRPGGGGTAMINFDYSLTLEKSLTVDAKPAQGAFDLADARIIAPGDPYASVLFYRMWKLGRGHMPHIGSSIADERGIDLIHEWIANGVEAPSRQVEVASAGGSGVETTEGGAARDDQHRDAFASTLLALRAAERSPKDAWTEALGKLFASTRSATVLSHVLAKAEVSEAVRKEAVQIGVRHVDVNVRDLFERFVPPEQRTKRLGESAEPNVILALDGNVERGRRAFFYGAASSCKNCHRVYDEGGTLGPALTEIGKKYKRHEILETIMKPSKQIEEKYKPYLLVTGTGVVASGLLVEKTDQQVVIKDAESKLVRVSATEVAQLTPQEKSLMPDLLLRDMTAQEAADLLAFLSSLK